MKSEKVLSATMLAALGIQTIGSVDGGHKLPSPRRFVAICLLWGILGLVAQGGPEAARATSRFSLLVLLTLAMAVVGKLTGFLDLVASAFPLDVPKQPASAAPAPPTTTLV